jgi:hypothetical protein
VRGFLGDYEIEVTAGGRTASGQASLLKEGTVVPVVLK